jgi:hypothetical protein
MTHRIEKNQTGGVGQTTHKPSAQVYVAKRRIRAAGDWDEGNPIANHTVKYPGLAICASGLSTSTISSLGLMYVSVTQMILW